jgi:hypothetical protein
MTVSGADLYVAGAFNQIGSASVTNLARWDGTTWLPVGEGLGLDFYQAGSIRAMSVFGTNVYLGGWFNSVGLPETTNIAGWNGSTWSALGNPFGMQDGIQFLASTEQFLYAAGSFTNAAGSLARNIARWDGAGWYALGEGLRYLNMYGRPYALSAGDGVVCVSGAFTEAGGLSSPQFAIWHEPPSAISLQRTIPPRPLRSVPPPPPVRPLP